MECYKCGCEGVRLTDVVSKEGIMQICANCYSEEELPVVKNSESLYLNQYKPKPFKKLTRLQRIREENKEDLKRKALAEEKMVEENTRKNRTVYERLSNISGINPKEHRENFFIPEQKKESRDDVSLKDIVERNFKSEIYHCSHKSNSDLINNFHWIIMRARRRKHLSQNELSDRVMVPVDAIKTLERGILPENYFELLTKIEDFLGIQIIKAAPLKIAPSHIREQETSEEVSFEKLRNNNLKIGDLHQINQKNFSNENSYEDKSSEEEVSNEFEENNFSEVKINEENLQKEEFSVEDVKDIIYGRK